METQEYTKTLARYATYLTFDDLPKPVVEQTKLCIMDTLGIALASPSIEDSTELILDFVRKLKGKKEATLFKYHDKVPCLNAILANSFLAHCIGFDDIHNASVSHIGAAVIPTAMATAERERMNGKDMITAVVLGYDVAARVGEALNPSSVYALGFHPSSLSAPFGCAATAAKLLELNEDQIADAFGLAGVQAAGPTTGIEKGPTSWFLQYGKAAQSGFLSAQLAQRGFTGPNMILEDQKGFCKIFSDNADSTKLTKQLREKFEIMENSIKLYPCDHIMHSGIDALREIMRLHSIEAEDIMEMTLKLPTFQNQELDRIGMPENRLSARGNGPYIMSVTAVGGDAILDINKLIEEKRNDPKIQGFLHRVNIIADYELNKIYPEKRPAIVEVKTKDGKKYTHRVDIAKGDPEKPLNKDEVESKFKRLAKSVLSNQKIEELLKIINKLEQAEDIPQLTQSLRF